MGSFWEELKDAFKTKSQRDEERSEQLKQALEQEKEVEKQLEELEKQYQAYLDSQKEEVNLDELFPPTLGLEKIDFLCYNQYIKQIKSEVIIMASKYAGTKTEQNLR